MPKALRNTPEDVRWMTGQWVQVLVDICFFAVRVSQEETI